MLSGVIAIIAGLPLLCRFKVATAARERAVTIIDGDPPERREGVGSLSFVQEDAGEWPGRTYVRCEARPVVGRSSGRMPGKPMG
jgi:hypothetical protein